MTAMNYYPLAPGTYVAFRITKSQDETPALRIHLEMLSGGEASVYVMTESGYDKYLSKGRSVPLAELRFRKLNSGTMQRDIRLPEGTYYLVLYNPNKDHSVDVMFNLSEPPSSLGTSGDASGSWWQF